MDFKFEINDETKEFLKESTFEEISIGCSNSQVIKISKNNDVYFMKLAPLNDLKKEFNALNWLDGKLSVPKIILHSTTSNSEILITKALDGFMICSDYYINDPEKAIDLLVIAFKDILSVNINDCPFGVGIDYKLNLVKENVEKGLITGEYISEDILDKYNGVNGILDYLIENKFYDDKCFSHGDTSLPNIFVDENKFIGFIDVGECGIADKWFDLAICEKSIIRNFGENYVNLFYEKLNIKPDRFKIDYYLLMMNLYL